MQYASYPALFRSADDASNEKQKAYLRLIAAEYAVLLLASVLSDSAFKGSTFYLLYAFIFVVSGGSSYLRETFGSYSKIGTGVVPSQRA